MGHADEGWFSAAMGELSEQVTFLSVMTRAGRCTVVIWVAHNEQRKTSNQALMANCNERQKRRLTFFNYWSLLFDVQQLSDWLWVAVIVLPPMAADSIGLVSPANSLHWFQFHFCFFCFSSLLLFLSQNQKVHLILFLIYSIRPYIFFVVKPLLIVFVC